MYNQRFEGTPETFLNKEQIKSFEYQELLIANIQLDNAKSFKLDNELAQLLWNTDSKLEYKHLPFPSIFLDTNVEIDEDIWIRGMLLFDLGSKEAREDPRKFGFVSMGEGSKEILINLIIQNRKTNECYKFNLYSDGLAAKGTTDKTLQSYFSSEKSKKKIRMFICSFLKFLYNPDVEVLDKIYTEKQIQRREKKGKSPYEDHFYLKITGKTRQYLDNFDGDHFTRDYLRRTHCWIVRGFYRKLTSLKYKVSKEIWIAPFIKGMGKPKQKEYLVTEKKKVWVNQLRMGDLIKELYPNHLVIPNTRGFLDGLEIDYYIPDLKLGFEYNGKQHYELVEVFHKDESGLKDQKERDELKNKIAKEKGIRLITLRYDEPLTKEYIKTKLKGGKI